MPSKFNAKIINGDVSGNDFDKKINKLPLKQKLLIFCLAPLYGVYMRWFATRQSILEKQAVEMLKSREDILSSDEEWDEISSILLDWRDEKVINILSHYIKPPIKYKKVAIVYGAEHMKAILTFLLLKEKFRVIKSDWLMVMKS